MQHTILLMPDTATAPLHGAAAAAASESLQVLDLQGTARASLDQTRFLSRSQITHGT
jgi:hypothetical protein